MMIVALEFWSVDFKSLWATLLIKVFFYISVEYQYQFCDLHAMKKGPFDCAPRKK